MDDLYPEDENEKKKAKKAKKKGNKKQTVPGIDDDDLDDDALLEQARKTREETEAKVAAEATPLSPTPANEEDDATPTSGVLSKKEKERLKKEKEKAKKKAQAAAKKVAGTPLSPVPNQPSSEIHSAPEPVPVSNKPSEATPIDAENEEDGEEDEGAGGATASKNKKKKSLFSPLELSPLCILL